MPQHRSILIKAFENNIYELLVRQTAYIYDLSRTSPAEAMQAMNRPDK